MQTHIVEAAGINPKTLLSNFLYWQRLERNVSTLLFLPYVILIVVSSLTRNTNSSTQVPRWEGWLIGLGIGGFVVGIIYNLWAIYAVPKIYAWRVRIFAKKNNLNLLPKSNLVQLLPETVRRSDVHNVQAVGCTLSLSGQQVTLFDYTCEVGSGKNKQYLAKGLAALSLKSDYPHLFLDSKKNGKNHQYATDQRVELEGDFSKYFDVYMPEGSQAGSLTVFAPDVMQTVLDSGKMFDVEISGNQAVIISDELVFTKKVLPNILNCAAALGTELKQLDRTWKPIFAANGKKFKLKGQPWWRVLLTTLVPFLLVLVLNLLSHRIRH